jgi:hypothetical protein
VWADKRSLYVSPKRSNLPTSPYGIITQKTKVHTFTAIATLGLIKYFLQYEFSFTAESAAWSVSFPGQSRHVHAYLFEDEARLNVI